jgi:signal transduction histidine kinase
MSDGNTASRDGGTRHPHHVPPIKVERLIAGARVVLAAVALLDLWFDLQAGGQHGILMLVCVVYYVPYSLALLMATWRPVEFTPAWGIASQMFDVTAFSLFAAFADAGSQVLVYFVFAVLCATVRWRSIGAFWTAAGAISVLALVFMYGGLVRGLDRFGIEPFARRSVAFAGTAALIGYLSTYMQPLAEELSRIALWPRMLPGDSRAIVTDILARSRDFLDATSVVLIWTEANEKQSNLAWHSDEGLVWVREPAGTYGTLVPSELERHSFLASDASRDNGQLVYRSGGRLRRRRGRAVDERLRARFEMAAVQSYRLDGEYIQGRLFCFGQRRMHVDDLIIGNLVARLTASELDSLHLVTQMGESAISEERLRVARDLHDSLAQSLAGTSLQLVAARRLLDFNPKAAQQRLDDVQHHLHRDQLEVRSVIRRLRPAAPAPSEPQQVGRHVRSADLAALLAEFRLRVEMQWNVRVTLHADANFDDWPDAAAEQVFRLIQEAVLNAARHAEASTIDVRVAAGEDGLRLTIEDDGKGYPFHGSFNLAALTAMQKGPLTLRERVTSLHGGLELRTSQAGTHLSIALPSALIET